MNDRECDLLLRRVLLDALEQEYPEPGSAPEASARHWRQMRAMVADPQGWYRRRTRPVWRRVLRTAAMVALTLAVGASALLAASPTIRAAALRWVMERYEDHVVYHFRDEGPEGELGALALAYLPDGYVEQERVKWPQYLDITFVNEAGQLLTVSAQRDGALLVDTEGMEVSDVTVNGYSGKLYLSVDQTQGNTIVWMDTAQDVQFLVDGYLTEQELLHIAEGIELGKTPN